MAVPPRGVLSVSSSDAGHVIASWNPLILACFTRPATATELGIIHRLAEEGLRDGIRGGIFYVVARNEMRGGIDPQVRRFFEKMAGGMAERAGASAAVLLSTGFANALLRSFLVGFAQRLLSSKRLQIFGAVDDAARWVAPLHGCDPQTLEEAFRRATAHLTLPDRVAQAG